MAIFKIEAEGDTVYVQQPTQREALDRLYDLMGPIPEKMLTISTIDALPEGEEFL